MALISALGCASTVPSTVFLPVDAPDVRSFFRNGQAIAAVYGDSTFVLAQIEPAELAGQVYMRLWLLVENDSETPFLLEPLKCAKLRTEPIGRPDKLEEFPPESPTRILASISNEQAVTSILQGIGAVLEAAAAQPTTATTSGAVTSSPGETSHVHSTTTINDTHAKRREILRQRADEINATSFWYESFKNSVNAGILRRNTIFPGESVNGYIYFDVDVNTLDYDGYATSRKLRHSVRLKMPEGAKLIAFEPIEGE